MSDDELKDITRDLGKYYTQYKMYEKSKDEHRQKFFELATKAVIDRLAEKITTTTAETEEEAREQIEKANPKWKIDDIRPISPGSTEWEAILKEDPAFKKFSFVNPDDGMVYERQVVSGSLALDDERLKDENPDLYRRVTRVPYSDWVKSVMYECGIHHNDVDEKFEDLVEAIPGGPERELVPLGELEADDLAELSEYIYEGKATVKLAAPREVKPEDQ